MVTRVTRAEPGRAAEALHLSQPALSRAVATLEGRIGVALLERTTRSVRLTAAGEPFLAHARDLLARDDDAVDAARRGAAGRLGRLTVAHMDFAILGELPRLVASFRRLYPQVDVDLRYSWTERQRGELPRLVASFRRLYPQVDVGLRYSWTERQRGEVLSARPTSAS